MFLRRLFTAVLFASCLDAGAAVDPSVFEELHWRLLGPFRGGRVLAVSGVPGEPQHFYFGSVNGGVWESKDAGRTWIPIFDAQPIGSIGALTVAPSNPKILYVGTGEADMRSDIAQGEGMYKSIDGGATWRFSGLQDSQQIGKILVHPTDPELVYVAALGHPYGPNAERGVFRSKDGGRSWQRILSRNNDSDTGAIDLAFDPRNPKILYASLWQTRRTPWSVYPPSNGPGSGLFKSMNGGDTWTELRGHGLPDKPGRIGIAVAPSRPDRVYAIIDAEEGGMYRSDDGGANWRRTSGDTRIWSRGWYFGGVTVEPENADIVFSCNVNLYRSDDGGTTFVPYKGAPGGDDYHALWIDPQAPERRILGVDQGALVSVNNGKSWSSWYNQPTGQFYHVSTDNRFPYWVYGSQQDSGAAGIPSRTNTIDGISLMNFRETTAGGESDNVVPDPRDPDIIYGGRVEKLDVRTQQTKSIDPTLAYMEHDRRTWTLPLVFSRRDPRVLYFGNQRMFRTDDGGEHWTVISPDLTREDPGTPANLDPTTAALNPQMGPRRGVIYAIAPSRLADKDIWAGTDDGQIWRTRDEGSHWENLTPPELTGWSKVGMIDPSHFDAETAYVAIDRHRLDDFKAYIYRTHDGGKRWKAVASGIPQGSFVNAVREDPVRQGLLYAATEKGVYVSFDDGDHWQPLQKNLPVTSVRDLDVNGNDLVIATHGRSFWIMDDVTPLRQTDEAAAGLAQGSYLFKPATAVRVRPAGFAGTPMPKDEPLAGNPPSGAYIDYVLPPAMTGSVTLEIFDDRNKLVRRYESSDPKPQPDLTKLTTAPEWFEAPSTLATSAGMHRFVWPIRYPAPKELMSSTMRNYSDGVWARPGNYTVVLTADRRVSQPLSIVADPRVKVTAADHEAQFALSRRIEEIQAAVTGAFDEADALLKALDERRVGATESLATTIDGVRARTMALSDIVPTKNPGSLWWLAPKRISGLRYVQSAVAKLAGAVDGADGAPTPDARVSYSKLQPAVQEAVKAWKDFKTKELDPLNSALKAAGKAEIVIP